ncbi:acyltransferase family protein [Glaesserella parasuis]|uniref:Acyltransferase family protein n=1 Tax=Glaesserella parasuis TaxID=738 RepID=A0AAJ6DD26_GLAPU|nr:acyltransferase family protein [Glaesserella parasuis]WGE10406.1 acyltransferase family protein [Glaesserella parasuis]
MSYNKLSYRPEVDGLRALAVLSVFIYHLNENWLTGGFLGVDIFFVISGFLITRIITTEMVEGKFEFKTFYNRRIKRIYPIFILTLFIASIFSSLVFIRSEGELLRKTIELAVGFVSNFYLSHRQGYFDLAANENPILHIWSLAVEEQYYILFPIILYFLYKKTQKSNIFMKVVIGLFVFFVLSSFLPKAVYESIGLYNSYYLSNLRFPELLIGSFLALLPSSTLSNTKNNVLSVFSLLGLMLCLVFYHKYLPLLPGVILLLPCALTALLIYSMQSKGIVNYIFSSKPMVFIGKISYSLYLFHWLFIALTHYITGQKYFETNAIILIVVLTFIFSIASYYLLEQPIRKSKLSFKQSLIYIYIIPSIILIGYNLLLKPAVVKRTEQFNHIEGVIKSSSKIDLPAKIGVIGDSHAGHLSEFFSYVGGKEGWKATQIDIHYDCHLPIDTQYQLDKKCEKYIKQLDEYPVIFISMFYSLKRGIEPLPRVTPREFFVEDFDNRFKTFVSHYAKTKKVYVFADVKMTSRSPLRSIYLDNLGLGKYLVPIQEMGDTAKTNEELRQVIDGIPNVKWVDPTKYLPSTYFVDGIPIYADQDHLTNFGSYYMGVEFHKHEQLLQPEEVKQLYEK